MSNENNNKGLIKTKGNFASILGNYVKSTNKKARRGGAEPGSIQEPFVDVTIPTAENKEGANIGIVFRNPYELGFITYVGKLEEGQKPASGNLGSAGKEYSVTPIALLPTVDGKTALVVCDEANRTILGEFAGSKTTAGVQVTKFRNANSWLPAFAYSDKRFTVDSINLMENLGNTVRFKVAEEATDVEAIYKEADEGKGYKKSASVTVKGFVLEYIGAVDAVATSSEDEDEVEEVVTDVEFDENVDVDAVAENTVVEEEGDDNEDLF